MKPGSPADAAASRFAEVALALAMDQTFTYEVPEALREHVSLGMRATVPFQRRMLTGYVVALDATTARDDVRPLLDLPDAAPVFSAELLELCRWMAEYYCCSLGEALQCALPAGIRMHAKRRYVLEVAQLATGRFGERQRKIIAELHRRGPLTDGQLAKAVGGSALSATLHALEERGIVRALPLVAESSVSTRTETYVRLVESKIPGPEELALLQRRAPRQAAVYLDLLHGQPERLAVHLYEKHSVTSSVLRALEERGLIERFEREHYRLPAFEEDLKAARKHVLNAEQQAAYVAITSAMASGTFQTFLLKGITGSGKTEVYLQAIEQALILGKDAIILVPEISLTPQTVGRFKARFKTNIAVLHSALGAGERYDEWRRAQRGEVRIVVGARSAIFAPLPHVGILVVDEEHDTSYKQTDTPRYHARDVAIMRAKIAGAVCVLGSATPSLESYYNSHIGKSVRVELHQRATSASLPSVSLVDMRKETFDAAGVVMLSRPLEAAIAARTRVGEQVLLFLNRRGFAPFVLCPKCAWVAQCRDCQVTMTYHAKGAFLSCHYCNARRGVPQVCGECGFNPLLFLGVGTQKVEDFLLRSFPDSRIERMDADTTAGKGGHARILGRLASGDIDILVGTQMIAKGHDYPHVTLVGVLDADIGLGFPDFRAAEHTFQLLTQVAGRAGRAHRPGEVIIQTYRPHHYAIQAAAGHDYDAFYRREIAERKNAGYPPLRRMASLTIECEDPAEAERAACVLQRTVREQIATLEFQGVAVIGPAPATVRRVKRKYRWNLGILSRSGKRLNQLARATRDAFPAQVQSSKVALKIDLDPYGMP